MDDATRQLVDRGAVEIRAKLAGGRLYGQPIDINNKNDCILGAYVLGQTEHSKLGYVSTPKPLSPPPHEAGGPSTPKPTPPKPEAYARPTPRPGQPSYSLSDDRLVWLVVGMVLTIVSILATLAACLTVVQYVIR